MKIISIQNSSKQLLKYFDCGEPFLNEYLKQYALKNDSNSSAKTFLCVDDEEKNLIGYFSLCTSSIQFNEYEPEYLEKIPRYPISCIKIARLAVAKEYQGHKIGAYLLKECFAKILKISSTVGFYLIVVDAKESSYGFYEHYGFTKLKEDSLTYFLRTSTLIKAVMES